MRRDAGDAGDFVAELVRFLTQDAEVRYSIELDARRIERAWRMGVVWRAEGKRLERLERGGAKP